MKVYTVQINYKSGISVVSEFVKFTFNGKVFEWEVYEGNQNPIVFGANEVESVWRLSTREVQEVEQ